MPAPSAVAISPEINGRTCNPRATSVGAGGGVRALLREKTAAAHARLDAALQTLELQSAPQYCRFLEAHAEALLPLEKSLAASGVRRLFPDWDQRARSRVLADDIARLGGEVRQSGLLAGPFDDAGLLGAMYVLEGSRLGAAVLLDIVSQSSDSVVRNATGFLSHGAQKRLWPSFLAVLERHGATLEDVDEAVAAARRVFALFETSFARIVVPANAASLEVS
jgi:heme oxygenase (biliverdin-IX-beta and delta-forming)